MRKDKAWLKEEIKKLITEESQFMLHAEMVDLGLVLLSIDELDEPEKPIIPQFVADWIEKWKDQGLAMYEWFSFDFDNKEDVEVNNWLYYDNDCEENKRREYLFIDAIRYGYEVEKEILWEIPMPNLKTTSGHIQYLTYNPKARTYFASRKNEKSKQTFNAKDLASVPEQYRHYAELCDFKKIQEVTE